MRRGFDECRFRDGSVGGRNFKAFIGFVRDKCILIPQPSF